MKNQAQQYQTEYGPILRDEFSFTHGSPYIKAGEKRIEVFTMYPAQDGLLYNAGLRDGDIIISESITGFYKLLYQSRGEQISIDVVDGGDGLPIEHRKIRTLTLNIPAE